jgi:hypothetical protein
MPDLHHVGLEFVQFGLEFVQFGLEFVQFIDVVEQWECGRGR